MPRFSTKNLTPAELKTQRGELKSSLKALAGSVKLNGGNVKAANAVHDKAVGDAGKVLAGAQKAHDTAVKAAGKLRDAALKAAEKEAKNLTGQVEAHNAKLQQIEAALAPAPETATA